MQKNDVSTTGKEPSRKSSKPVMEKKRRARINASLAELKRILLSAIESQNARHSKMEKADILEMTVKHLRRIQRQHCSYEGQTGSRKRSLCSDSTTDTYHSGYKECTAEVRNYFETSCDISTDTRKHLLEHLDTCLSRLHTQNCEPNYLSLSDNCSSHRVRIQPVISKGVQPTEVPLLSTARYLLNNEALLNPQISLVQSRYPSPLITEATVLSESHGFPLTNSLSVSQDILRVPTLCLQRHTNVNANVYDGLKLVPRKLPNGEINFPTSTTLSSESESFVDINCKSSQCTVVNSKRAIFPKFTLLSDEDHTPPQSTTLRSRNVDFLMKNSNVKKSNSLLILSPISTFTAQTASDSRPQSPEVYAPTQTDICFESAKTDFGKRFPIQSKIVFSPTYDNFKPTAIVSSGSHSPNSKSFTTISESVPTCTCVKPKSFDSLNIRFTNTIVETGILPNSTPSTQASCCVSSTVSSSPSIPDSSVNIVSSSTVIRGDQIMTSHPSDSPNHRLDLEFPLSVANSHASVPTSNTQMLSAMWRPW